MRIVRLIYKKTPRWGILESGYISILKSPPFDAIELAKEKIPFKEVKLLPPSSPSKIILVGLNYSDHAREINMELPDEPVIFLKPPTSLIGNRDDIIYPDHATRVELEAELAVVIRKTTKDIRVEDAKSHILGYSCLNDVTERSLQKKDVQWTRAKSFDTFCPFGPWIETGLEPFDLKIKSYINNNLTQDSSTRNLIFPVEEIISFISSVMTLLPGDIISTGTPSGVAEIKKGDLVEIDIEGIGRLSNRVG